MVACRAWRFPLYLRLRLAMRFGKWQEAINHPVDFGIAEDRWKWRRSGDTANRHLFAALFGTPRVCGDPSPGLGADDDLAMLRAGRKAMAG